MMTIDRDDFYAAMTRLEDRVDHGFDALDGRLRALESLAAVLQDRSNSATLQGATAGGLLGIVSGGALQGLRWWLGK